MEELSLALRAGASGCWVIHAGASWVGPDALSFGASGSAKFPHSAHSAEIDTSWDGAVIIEAVVVVGGVADEDTVKTSTNILTEGVEV